MSSRSSNLELLGLGIEASADEIIKAFRSKAKQHHPDFGGDTETFVRIQRAYEELKEIPVVTRSVLVQDGHPFKYKIVKVQR